MEDPKQKLLWSLFIELRKELVESQKIRAQVLGFKFTFVATAVGVIVANLEDLDPALLVIPAIAGVCFDLIIYSYSFSIKRIGMYCREYLEPVLLREFALPENFVLWQRYLQDPRTRQSLATWGNLGFTLLVVLVGFSGLYFNDHTVLQLGLGIVLLLFFLVDVILTFVFPWRLGKIWKPVALGNGMQSNNGIKSDAQQSRAP